MGKIRPRNQYSLGFNVCIPDNDPVRLISQFVEEMDLTAVLLFLQAVVIL